MKLMSKILSLGIMGVFLMLPAAAMADSITPESFSATLDVGESVTIHKTVTITKEITNAKVDVFFLCDTTGSMGDLINSIKSSAGSILANTAGLGDVAFGVGEYKDFNDYDEYAYKLNTDFTTDQATVQTGLNQWSADGGGDWHEGNLHALNEATKASWRDDSTRILVWFGDAPGHDPSGEVTEEDAISALNANNIIVQAMNTSLDDDYNLDYSGQATRITEATGGTYFDSVDTGVIVDEISNAITSVFDKYSTVSLGVSGDHDGVDVSITSASGGSAITGDFDRSEERTFEYDVTFTGTEKGTYDFTVDAFVDGGFVAAEYDHIVVTDGSGSSAVPEPSTIMLLGIGLIGLAGLRRKSKKK